MEEIDIKTVRALKDALVSAAVHPSVKRYPIESWSLTEDGVAVGSNGWMHPETFRSTFGEDEYQALLSRPQVASLYPEDKIS